MMDKTDGLARAKADAFTALGSLAARRAVNSCADRSISPTETLDRGVTSPRAHPGDLKSETGEQSCAESKYMSASSGNRVAKRISSQDVDYVSAEVNVPEELGEFLGVLSRFAATGHQLGSGDEPQLQNFAAQQAGNLSKIEQKLSGAPGEGYGNRASQGVENTDQMAAELENDGEDLSKRQRRKRNRLSIAQLKALVREPGSVEQWDVTAEDPLLLIHLKALKGSVPVPVNWRMKRKYLQSKRGMEKAMFKMPSYIENTGVGAARAAATEADAAKTAKQKARERIRPKASGQGVDVDYSVLRDAFFKFQTKPRLTGHGDLYYELREREVKHEHFRPGLLGSSLREALGIGATHPPPWLVAMQRYGPPPSYPALEIPGLNAPIPVGATFGYHPGGWGKPPVDACGRPLYGDVFGEGTGFNEANSRFQVSLIDREKVWGEVRPAGEFDVDDDDETGPDFTRKGDRHRDGTGGEFAGDGAGAISRDRGGPEGTGPIAARSDPSEVESTIRGTNLMAATNVPVGLETPVQGIELRKGLAPGQLYTVLEQKDSSVGKGGLMGSSHIYSVGSVTEGTEKHPQNPPSLEVQGENGEKLPRKRKEVDIVKEEGRNVKKAKEAKELAIAREKDFKF